MKVERQVLSRSHNFSLLRWSQACPYDEHIFLISTDLGARLSLRRSARYESFPVHGNIVAPMETVK